MRKIIVAAALAATCITNAPAFADDSSGHKAQMQGEDAIPHCTHRLGTVAVVEPDNNWWQALGLGSPEAVIKMFVMRSGCFGLVDRGKGLQSRNMERALADNGELQDHSNIGRHQVKAADYFIVPDIISKNHNSGGGNIGGFLGGFMGGTVGAIAGGINIKKKEANVMLTLTNARTTEQEQMEEGYYRKTDVGFGGGGGLFGAGTWGGLGGGGYQDTDIGQVIVLAYLDAYKKLVGDLGGLPKDASAAAPQAH